VIDSHCHLDHVKRPVPDVVADADAAGVKRLLSIGMDTDSCRATLQIAEDYPQVYVGLGRHPNSATDFDDADATDLAALAAHERCVAIGETGLDYYRDRATKPDQMRAFRAQIELARQTGKPLVIHTRAAEDDTLATLTEHAGGLTVILHCFSMPDRLDECLEHAGWLFSFAGNATYPKAPELREAARRVPADRLLVETDSPYLAPQPVRGKPNEPRFVVETARVLAAERGETYEELERNVDANAARVFGW
jgi:TatD DNase family protein